MNRFKLPIGIYAITDSECANNKNFLTYCEELLQGGAKIIQYREKSRDMKKLFKEAKELRELTQKYNAIFIVNDHLDIALLVDADGIHIGQDDLPISEVRKVLGKNKIIGISTHNLQEAEDAVKNGADYIGVGPIFHTDTKKDAGNPLTLKFLEEVEANITLPYTVIGGIKEHNLEEVLSRGAKSVCLISELICNKNTFEITKRINEKIKSY
ncbi:MAG: thiamine phosphate synthase [Cetobacterium sp.]|uniref:thiamine phosphate synthase n=1 Tax=unclassified Cetobacterium TaxID=2630983 RepID=UPI0006490092|nr:MULTISPECIES: thiamine phosphate synthase [unclassified Cetobacterium]